MEDFVIHEAYCVTRGINRRFNLTLNKSVSGGANVTVAFARCEQERNGAPSDWFQGDFNAYRQQI